MRTIVPLSLRFRQYWSEESHSTNHRSRIEFGKEKIEWPVIEIVVSSLKKIGKVEKAEVDTDDPLAFSEPMTDADVPF
jgi:hypothetical protein